MHVSYNELILVSFFVYFIFGTVFFLKGCLILDGLALCMLTKYNICFENADFLPNIYKLFHPSIGNLTTHITINEDIEKSEWKCADCNEICPDKTGLICHFIKTHVAINQCKKCGKKFRLARSLR